MKLLLIEDDTTLANHLALSLQAQGFAIHIATTQTEIEDFIESPIRFDFIVMDRLLGNWDSKTIMQDVRAKWPKIPLVILSAVSTPNERTELLNLGADDYMGKPFSTQEFVARVRALLRRTTSPVDNYIKVGNVIIDSMRRLVAVEDKTDTFPTREFSVLRTLALDTSKIWSKEELLDYVWGQRQDVQTNVVESTIANVRKRLGELGADISVRNLRNAGYWLAK